MELYNQIRILGVLRYFLYKPDGLLSDVWITVISVLAAVVCLVVPYFLGGLNFAIILSKKKYGVDVREFGSGNAGMTNMRRTFGKKAGLMTLAGDAGKAFVSCILGYILLGLLGAYIAGLFCTLGHMFPWKYKFKGGKGFLCAAVVVLMTDIGNPTFLFIPILFLILLACFIVIVLFTKYVSLGSIMTMLVYPLFLNAFQRIDMEEELSINSTLVLNPETGLYTIIAFIIAMMVVFMHRENIKRLWQGKESKFELHLNGKKTLYEESLKDKDMPKADIQNDKMPSKNTSTKKKKQK